MLGVGMPATHRIITSAGTFLVVADSLPDVWEAIDRRAAMEACVGLVRFNPAHVVAVVVISP